MTGIDYNELFKTLQKNLEHFKFGENGEGWFSGFNLDKDGKWNGLDLKDFAKKVSDILGYDINFDEDKNEDKKPAEKTLAKYPEKKPCNENKCNENSCNCKADTFATCAYKVTTECNNFKLEVLIPGETVDNFRISVNTKEMKLKVARRAVTTDLPWYAACKEDIVIDLPAGIKTESLKKASDNGLLVITGKIAQQKDFETEI